MGDIYMKYRSKSDADKGFMCLFSEHLAQKCRR